MDNVTPHGTDREPREDEPQVRLDDLEAADADPKGGPTEELFGNYNLHGGGKIKPKGSISIDGS
jgi:hypothetical protein